MNTPIFDFVRQYADDGVLRLHMPGHKGNPVLGVEHLDITEIHGADSLYEADGIIRESEENASSLFGCPTYYSTEGSSQCIRAMLYLSVLHAKESGRRPYIAAARNAHKTFLSAAALLDLDIFWLTPGPGYLSCVVSPEELDRMFSAMPEKPSALYITSPDYLGTLSPIREIAVVCKKHSVLLLVDNAHGAYLRFLPASLHPIDLGADMCCDSAHKTLPVLTGGAYLHISPTISQTVSAHVKNALALFGSTSPSYLILQSLDLANRYLSDSYTERLSELTVKLTALKQKLSQHGYILCGNEPMKLTVSAKPYGYTGIELAGILLKQGIVSEFSDPDFLVLMPTPETGDIGLEKLKNVLLTVPRKDAISVLPPETPNTERVLSVREAALSPQETIPVEESLGRVLSAASVGCPPAVPIVICGERINEAAVQSFSYYGITHCTVVK